MSAMQGRRAVVTGGAHVVVTDADEAGGDEAGYVAGQAISADGGLVM